MYRSHERTKEPGDQPNFQVKGLLGAQPTVRGTAAKSESLGNKTVGLLGGLMLPLPPPP